jgi:hypothetical protein
MRHPSTYMSKCNIQQCLCHIMMFIKVDIALRHSIRVHVRVQCTSKFRVKCDVNNGYVAVQHSSKITFHYKKSEWLCRNASFIKVHVTLPHPIMALCRIAMTMPIKVFVALRCSTNIATFIKVHDRLCHKAMVISHFDVFQRLRHITTSINGYVRMRCPSTYRSQSNIHQHVCDIATFIKVDMTL